MHVDASADLLAFDDHTIMATASSSVFSCGDNGWGQLGHGDATDNRSVPTEVTALASQRVVSVAAAAGFSLAITAGGDALHWGRRFESFDQDEDEDEHQTQPARLWSFPTAVLVPLPTQ